MPHIPSETDPQPVPEHPEWLWWPGVARVRYAKHLNGIDPPIVVRGRNWTALLAEIRKTEDSWDR